MGKQKSILDFYYVENALWNRKLKLWWKFQRNNFDLLYTHLYIKLTTKTHLLLFLISREREKYSIISAVDKCYFQTQLTWKMCEFFSFFFIDLNVERQKTYLVWKIIELLLTSWCHDTGFNNILVFKIQIASNNALEMPSFFIRFCLFR